MKRKKAEWKLEGRIKTLSCIYEGAWHVIPWNINQCWFSRPKKKKTASIVSRLTCYFFHSIRLPYILYNARAYLRFSYSRRQPTPCLEFIFGLALSWVIPVAGDRCVSWRINATNEVPFGIRVGLSQAIQSNQDDDIIKRKPYIRMKRGGGQTRTASDEILLLCP